MTGGVVPEPAEARVLLPRAERQAAILRGAAKAFARAGFAATSMEDVATAAGITKLIVYRHFDSKEELYRAVLQRVSDRLVEEFLAGIRRRAERGIAARALLVVAREDPDAFSLLMRHAVREEPFTDYVLAHHRQAVALARNLVGGRLQEEGFDEWAAETLISHLNDAVLHWVELGDPARDDEFVTVVTAGMIALAKAWGSAIPG